MKNLVNFKIHGILASQLKNSIWNLAINSVSEGIHAINILTKKQLYKNLLENDKKNIKYRVLINGRDFKSEKPLDISNIDTFKNSELAMTIKNLRTIDIVPVIEGAADIFTAIAGVFLIIIGAILAPAGIGVALIVAGLGLLAAGIMNLLSKPPKFEDFRDISNSNKKVSYLFNGPENIQKEGGPVPVGYGRLIVGSQAISASYVIEDKQLSSQGYISQ